MSSRKGHSCDGPKHDESCAACLNLARLRAARKEMSQNKRLVQLMKKLTEDVIKLGIPRASLGTMLMGIAVPIYVAEGVAIETMQEYLFAAYISYCDLAAQDKQRAHLSVVDPE